MEDLEELLRPLLPSSIEMVIDVESALPRVSADPTQLQQVLLNLAVNARDAMKERGELAIRARIRELGPEEARNIVGARPGSFIELSVSDTGSGLSPEVLSRVFEPFFTTKPVGEGTGLGLAIVHGVVNAHGGWLEVESDPGCGSTFRVLLPVADSAVLDGDSPVPAQPDAQGETILVVDDEATIRRLVKLELSRCGYCVREATNGAEAVERVRSDPGEIDLVVMDLTMPVLDGLEARAAILGLAPGMPVLLTSGRPPEARVEDESNPLGFLAKPYPMSQLTHRIRELLDRRCPG
jgi:CheY-like chemotaxis protein